MAIANVAASLPKKKTSTVFFFGGGGPNGRYIENKGQRRRKHEQAQIAGTEQEYGDEGAWTAMAFLVEAQINAAAIAAPDSVK